MIWREKFSGDLLSRDYKRYYLKISVNWTCSACLLILHTLMIYLVKRETELAIFSILISVFILILDAFAPLGVAIGMLYVIPVFLALFSGSEKLLTYLTISSLSLIIIGYFISPRLITFWVVILNRILSLLIVSSTALLANKYLALQLAREKSEQVVRDLNVQLMQSNKELESFAHVISHDLKGPLHTTGGFINFVLEDYGSELKQNARELLQKAVSGVDTMNKMINSILALSKLAGTAIQRDTEVDLTEIARSIIEELKSTAPTRVIEINIQEKLSANGDSTLLHIVLQNLLGNAWKFTGKTQNPMIEFGSKESPDTDRVFYVKDNGAGFDMTHKKRLFQLFSRLHSANEFEGTGTGLATVKRIIDKHGGRIWVESDVGKGTTFFFTLNG